VTIPPELEAQILRYYHVERWRPNTIARQLRVHHAIRVLARAGLPRIGRPRPSRVDPYLPFILAILEKFPTLTASWLHAMVRERGYRGGPDHFRHVIACHRPRPKAEAYCAWVERAVRFARDAFFAGRSFADLADLNAQADAWCQGMAADRRYPGDDSKTVREAFAEEAPRLLALPGNPYPLYERMAVIARKTPYVRFDLNDHSIPHTHVGRTLTLTADLEQVRILDGQHVVACHLRSFDKGAQVEDPAHIAALVAQKHGRNSINSAGTAEYLEIARQDGHHFPAR
jgi:hypothetical protein